MFQMSFLDVHIAFLNKIKRLIALKGMSCRVHSEGISLFLIH